MTQRALIGPVCALFFGLVNACAAHELGIERIELIEGPNGQYVLTAEVPAKKPGEYPMPVLPERFELEKHSVGERRTSGEMVRYEFRCPNEGDRNPLLRAGDTLGFPWTEEGVIMVVEWRDGTRASRFFPRGEGGITIDLADLHAGSGSLLDSAIRYTELGVEHILFGWDHLLFVLGLLLIVESGWKLVKTITAFTVAHSITLALATLEMVHVPSQAVEATIALSIAFLAVEILHARQGRIGLAVRSPWIIAFGFGLLHGLGFAGALAELGLPQREIPIALLFFNVGVEVGQLIFVFVFLALRWASRRMEIRWPVWLQQAPAYFIGTLAMYWFLERAGGLVLVAWQNG